MTTLSIHPELAELMPARTEQEERELQDSIRRYGVREPITIAEIGGEHYIVDGHNRYRIATEEGVQFETREYEFRLLDTVYAAADRAREQLEAAREDRETRRHSRSGGSEDAREASERRVKELEAKVPELESTLEDRVARAKLDEVKLYMIHDALARRNVTPTDKVILTRKAKEILYKREAREALQEARDRGRESRYSGKPPIGGSPTESTRRVSKQIAGDAGVSEKTTERVMFVQDVAEGKREEFADKRDLAREQLQAMRRGEVAPSAAEREIRQGVTDTEARKPTASVPEDTLCRWLSDKRGWNTPAIAVRYKALYNDADKLADWLEELAAKLRER